MKPVFLLRLSLDGLAMILLLLSLAYGWLGNAAHEIVGTGMFLLLFSHNVFNRRWYRTVTKRRLTPHALGTKAVNLALLSAMLALLVTSVVISQDVFGFLPLTATFGWRQFHALLGYVAFLAAGIHLGLNWRLVMGVARVRFGITTDSLLRARVLRAIALGIAGCGLYSLISVDIASKLLMRVGLDFWDFERETPDFFLHHVAIIGLCACIAHYMKAIR